MQQFKVLINSKTNRGIAYVLCINNKDLAAFIDNIDDQYEIISVVEYSPEVLEHWHKFIKPNKNLEYGGNNVS